MTEETVTTRATDLPKLLGKPIIDTVAGVPTLLLPPDWTSQMRSDLLPAPQRISREVKAHEVGGFISYVNRFRSPATALYCTAESAPGLLARLDDHQPGKPSHVDHTAHFPCPVTEEWMRWAGIPGKAGMDRQPKSQKDFATFIEDNLRDILEPTGVDFLSVVTNFSDSRKVEFRSATRLDSGRVHFQYSDKDAPGEAVFPTRITIAIPVFMGVETRYRMDARIKYRLNGSDLVMWLELDRPDLRKRAAYEDLIGLVEKETGLTVHRAI